jgi:alpha-aminoadipate carrier protein LysW
VKRKFTICPMCGGEIEIFEDTDEGDMVSCDECGREFEVASRKPIKLNLSDPDDEFDAYDEDDEFDENR